jgi:TRAP-type C4-dicarboxylate transport system permease small subunit
MDNNISKPKETVTEAPQSGSETIALQKPPGMWEQYGNLTRTISRAISIIGMLGLFALVIFTVIEVLGSKLLDRPIPGYTGIIELCQLIVISFAMGITYVGGHHITIELLKGRLPRRLEKTMYSVIQFLGLVLFILIIWRLILMGNAFLKSNEVVDQIFIPLYPFPYAMAVAMAPICLILIYELGNSIRGMVNR